MSSNIIIKDYKLKKYKNFVSSFRMYEFNESETLSLNPEGNLEFIFQLSGKFAQKSRIKEGWAIRPTQFLGGLHNHSFQVKSLESKAKIVSVRFTPLGARSFLNERLDLYKNGLIEFDDLNFSSDFGMLENDSDLMLLKNLDKFLSAIYVDKSKNVIDLAAELLIDSHGFISIKSIIDRFNLSPSYFRSKFNEQVGMSPKEYSKILRMNQATKLMALNRYESLTDLAHKLGYFDQSHFIKDFKSVTGQTPKKYVIA